jgi:hypothetical protein
MEREAGGGGTESGDEAGGGDDGLLDDEDLELVHHAHGCCCSCCSAIPLPSSFAAVVAKRTISKGPFEWRPKSQSPEPNNLDDEQQYYVFTLCTEEDALGIFGQRWRISSGQSEYCWRGERIYRRCAHISGFSCTARPPIHPLLLPSVSLPLSLSQSSFFIGDGDLFLAKAFNGQPGAGSSTRARITDSITWSV